MMMKSFVAAGVAVFTLAGAASAATIDLDLDLFVTSHNDVTNANLLIGDTGTPISTFVDPNNATGSLSLSFDSDDAAINGGIIFFGDLLNAIPTSFDMELTLGGITQNWGEADFLIATAGTDLSGTMVEFLDFILLASGRGAFDADPNLIDVTPAPGNDFLRFSAAGELTGVNLELQSQFLAPIPVPASLPLLAGGLFAFGALRRRQSKNA